MGASRGVDEGMGGGMGGGRFDEFPRISTFHSIAFHWTKMFFKACGFTAAPTPVVTKGSQKALIRRAASEITRQKRRQRSAKALGLSAASSTWTDVFVAMRESYVSQLRLFLALNI